MQLATTPTAVGDRTESSLSATQVGRLLATGVGLAGAGVIAVHQIAPAAPAVQQHAVHLANTTAENISNLTEALSANPSPIGAALGELASYYTQTTQDSITGMLQGVEGIWTGMGAAVGLETILPQVTELLQQGDYLGAWDLINWDLLFDMQNVFQPLFDHTVRGTGEFVPGVFGIGADLTRVWANLQDLFGDFGFWKSTAKYLTEPFLGYMFAQSEGLSPVEGHQAQDPMDALLNGYVTWDSETGEPTGQWWGLLTEQGTASYFLDVLPTRIADALTADLPVNEGVDADAGAAAFTAADGLFDTDWLTGIFS